MAIMSLFLIACLSTDCGVPPENRWTRVVLQAPSAGSKSAERAARLDSCVQILGRRLHSAGFDSTMIQRENDSRIVLHLPGTWKEDRLSSLLTRPARLELRRVADQETLLRVLKDLDLMMEVPGIFGPPGSSPLEAGWAFAETDVDSVRRRLAEAADRGLLPTGHVALWGRDEIHDGEGRSGRVLYLCHGDNELNGCLITGARAQIDEQRAGIHPVGFELDTEGSARFASLTGESIGRRIAIILDGEIVSAPVVRARIDQGRGILDGGFALEEALEIAAALEAGPLPLVLRLVESAHGRAPEGDDRSD